MKGKAPWKMAAWIGFLLVAPTAGNVLVAVLLWTLS